MAYRNYYESEDTAKSIWNIDDAVMKTIYNLKVQFLIFMQKWDMENAYWILTLIDMEVSSKFSSQEQTKLDKSMNDLEESRKDFAEKKISAGKFFLDLRNIYKKMNLLMKEHGLYFREAEDDVGL